ncbi:CooT family nickel-binding protein [Candidatus Bathyarchaeota archaeon]|nr:CooT family nickel-binding protein [Candidatus Bathyarchaeota archaeon]
MCEFTVFLNKEVVCRDVVYAKNDSQKVVLKDVLGVMKVIENCMICEVDVTSERLLLTSK